MYYNYNDENESTGTPETPEIPTEPNFVLSPEPVSEEPVYEEPAAEPVSAESSEYSTKYYEPWRDPECSEPEDMHTAYSPNYYRASTAGYSGAVHEHAPKKEKKKTGKGKAFLRAVCLVLVCALFSAGAAGIVTNYMLENADYTIEKQVVLGAQTTASDSQNSTSSTNTVTVPDGSVMSEEEIYELACQQAVGIQLSATATNIFGQATTNEAVIGSGFVISEDGYIVTNYHVAEPYLVYGSGGGYDLKVVMFDDTVYDAEVVGFEKQNDIAVLKINASGLTPVTIGNMSDVKVGNDICVVGNPLGELTYTMTTGRVSALDRVISTEVSTSINVFQIDAAVNSGNSGGPVYNDRGEVIGIVDAKYMAEGVEGLGFVIPIDDAMNIITELVEHGYVTGKAYFGISGQTVNETAAMFYKMPQGTFVYSVEPGSCAEKAGIQSGDVITKLGDEEIKSFEDLQAAKYAYSAGDTTTVTISRSGEEMVLTVTFDEQPANTQS